MGSIIDTTVYKILGVTWPTLLITSTLIVVLRIVYLIKSHKEFIFYKEILYFTFMLYLFCVLHLTTLKDINISDGNNLRLFSEILRYDFGSRLFFKNIIGNVIMFIPYGFFSSLYIKIKRSLSAFLLIFISSLTIETIQLLIGRVFDVDDIVLNVVGGMIGYLIYKLISKIGDIFPFLKNKIILNILTILMLIISTISISFVIWR